MFLTLILHLLSAQAGPPEASPPGPVAAAPDVAPPPPVECSLPTHPEWLRMAAYHDKEEVFPPAAKAAKLKGSATMECRVTAAGRLADCRVIAETPEGAGFGDATVAVAPKFRMRPVTRSGCPVAGAIVRVAVKWDPEPWSWNTPTLPSGEPVPPTGRP